MSSYFLVLHTLCDAPHPSKHEIIDDIRIESGRTQPVCVYSVVNILCGTPAKKPAVYMQAYRLLFSSEKFCL